MELLRAAMMTMELPPGMCFVDVAAPLQGYEDFVSVYVYLKAPATKGPDDLRSVATDIARMLKTKGVSSRIGSLRVTNWGLAETGGRRYDAFLKDDAFQSHAWDGSLPREVEMAQWEVQYPE
ncbi:hypothetical protein FEK35_02175 [Nocardia cyriacigeorgica]|uniref:Uncharacterized protein n=1 Tax=Nocardia cyriacigeorgica TaxID=135487 RepID=A0A5R8PMS6_9NOCA|nr:hypothetical protein [Nocardia cyriacigeorgica]TLG17951.1 hypothetical protein FEK35_02175 [Nocardia cyriacigeorgica]